jgi:hypothetical protein
MATQYSPLLKLALPVTGELSGTWGDVVNDNITSMIEQAVAGLATINTWTANSHTLTTANGTTSESRCAMLVAADGTGGTALTAAGEIICPTTSKLYVVRNGSSYAVTLKTAAGTGIAVPTGQTAFLFCDGTNVNACVTTIVDGNISGNLTVNGNTTLGDANTDTVTVNARFNTDLLPSTDNARDLGSSGNSWKDLWIDGTATIATLNVTTTNATTVDTTNIEVTNIKAKDGTASATIADSTGVMTIASSVLTTTDINGGTIDGTVIGGASAAAGTFTTLNANGNVTLGDASTDTVTVNGYMGVGGAGTATAGIYVGSTALLGTSVFGIHSSPRSTTLNTTSLQSYYSVPITVASAHTVADVAGYRAADATKGAGSTITNQHGLRITDQTQGTNNYGITSLVSSGTDKWNIYAGGTAQNYFAGNVQFAAGSAAAPALTRFGDDNTGIFFPAADTLAASTAGSERLRITSSGDLLVGTTSNPQNSKLMVGGNVQVKPATNNSLEIFSPNSGTGIRLFARNDAGTLNRLELQGGQVIFPLTSGADGLYFDATTGNLGLGVTPSAWSGFKALQVGGGNALMFTGANAYGQFYMLNNAYYNGSNYIYQYTQAAAMYAQNQGAHLWYTAPSGTAGNTITFTQAMTLDASGNLGIGTSLPSVKLQVYNNINGTPFAWGNAARTGYLYQDANGVGITNASGTGFDEGVYLDTANSKVVLYTNSTGRVTLDASGNLGLGVTPSAWDNTRAMQLGLSGSVYGDGQLVNWVSGQAMNAYGSLSGGVRVWKYISAQSAHRYEMGNGAAGSINGHAWYTAASGTAGNAITFTQAMTLDASGNLLVGGTTALKTATIRGTGLAIVGGPNQNVGNELYFYRSDNMPMGYIGWETPASANSPWTFDSLNGNAIRWAINSTERARIDSNGNLLVGTTTNPGGPGRIGINFDSSANFGISLKSTNVSDNGVYLRFFNSSNTSAGQIVQTAATTVSYATSSDYRLKNAIAPMTGALAKVALLKPCTYKWNADGSDGQGFIAHELAEVVPQCVTGEKDDVDAEGKPQYQGIDTSFLVATLTAAIQEQQAIIESLTARIAALESK